MIIAFASLKLRFLLPLLMCYRCYGNLKFPYVRLIMGKVKVGLLFYLTADILTKVLQKYSLSSPLSNILFLSKPLNLIGNRGNQKAKFAK